MTAQCRHFTLDQVRSLLREQIRQFAGSRKNGTGAYGWAKGDKKLADHASLFLSGDRGPGPGVLNAMGLEWRIVPKQEPESGECP